MGISLSAQTAYFLWSLVLGAALGVLYDVIRAARMVLRAGKIHVLISDVVFFAVCGVITSLFALPFNKGNVRGFILFGEAVGFLAYRLTLGAVMGKVYAFLSRVLLSFVQKIRRNLEKIFNYLLKAMGILLYNVNVLIDKSLKRAADSRKKKHTAKQNAQRYSHKGKIYEKKTHRKTANRGKKSVTRH